MPPKKGRSFGSDPSFKSVVDQVSGGYRTVGQMVYEVIKKGILDGSFAPGEWLRQESLADAIGVSRLPVRSALLQLEAEGHVTFHPHRGAQVRTVSADQIDEIYSLRTLLETYALRRSMPRMTPERIEILRTTAAKIDGKPSSDEFVDLRVLFYNTLYDGEQNPLLVRMIEQLRSEVGRYLLGFRFAGHRASSHEALIDAVAAGDLASAEAWIQEHLDGVRKGIEEVSTREQPESDEVTAGSEAGTAV